MASSLQHLYSLEEYLELEKKANYKSEFHAGEIYAMAGGTGTHSRLSSRMNAVLDRRLPGCQIFDSNLKLYIQQANQCVYPDCMAVCGDSQFCDASHLILVNPTVIVEVLSPSTERYDKETKVFHYRSVPSIQNILLISQDRVFVEHFLRQDEHTWMILQYNQRQSSLFLQDSEITLEEIYREIL